MKFLVLLVTIYVAGCNANVPRLDHRIVGGLATTIEQFPYQVSVRIYDQHICGGCILDKNTILTAAHCVYGMDHSRYSVRLGSTQHKQGMPVKVSRVIMNKNYDPNSFNNDMAILKLASEVKFGPTIQPISLQAKGVELTDGTMAFVSGWGVTYEGSHLVPETLRMVDVNVISNMACNYYYGRERISPHMLCARTLNHDSCQGDSGGPLAANGQLIGIVSWGYGCARPQYPGVYAKVSNMHDWITSNK